MISGSIMVMISNALMLYLAGADGVAALSIVSYAETFLLPVLMGATTAIQPIISYNHGAKNQSHASETFKLTRIITGIISVGATAVMLAFSSF